MPRRLVSRKHFMLILSGHKGHVNDLAFSPDGLWLVSCGFDGSVRLWNTRTREGSFLFQLKRPSDRLRLRFGEFTRIVFSRDGTYVVAISTGGGFQVWNVAEKRRVTNYSPRNG